MKTLHEMGHDWWASLLCVLALLGSFYVLLLAGAPVAVAVLVLVGACLATCALATFMALRIRKKVDKALHDASHRVE